MVSRDNKELMGHDQLLQDSTDWLVDTMAGGFEDPYKAFVGMTSQEQARVVLVLGVLLYHGKEALPNNQVQLAEAHLSTLGTMLVEGKTGPEFDSHYAGLMAVADQLLVERVLQ